jgi:hypothetical protein
MSGKNGDRSRYDRQRKSKMHNRSRVRLLKESEENGDCMRGLWIIGKDAGWLMTMGLVFVTTFALSFFAPSSRP